MTHPLAYLLGRVEVERDPRNRNFPAPVAEVTRSVRWAIPPLRHRLDQAHVGSCTTNAGAHWRNSRPAHMTGDRYLTEDDALDMYEWETAQDGFPGAWKRDGTGQDTGSTGPDAAKALVHYGHASGYVHAFGLDHAIGALQKSGVMFGTRWTTDMFYPNAKGFIDDTGAEEGGHEYFVYGANLQDEYLACLNSWKKWGLYQRFYLPFATADRLLRADGDVTVPVR